MSSYILSIRDNTLDIDKLNLGNGYMFDDNVTLYDENLKNRYAKNKFIKLYILTFKKIQAIIDADPDDDGFKRSISEVDRIESLLKGEYVKYLKATEYEYFLKDIKFVKESVLDTYANFKKKAMRR